jgi:hypothetical protein
MTGFPLSAALAAPVVRTSPGKAEVVGGVAVAYEQAKTSLIQAERPLTRKQRLFEQPPAARDDLAAAGSAVANFTLIIEMYDKLYGADMLLARPQAGYQGPDR